MPWEQREQLKQCASRRQETGMRLNRGPADDGPGTGPAAGGVTGGVKSTEKAWNDAGAIGGRSTGR